MKKKIRVTKPAEPFNRLSEGKTINVSELPKCPHKDLLVAIVNDPKVVKICVVAFMNPDRKWVALAGYPDVRDLKPVPVDAKEIFIDPIDAVWRCENIRDVMEVTMMGERLPNDTAIKLFPDWSVVTYFE